VTPPEVRHPRAPRVVLAPGREGPVRGRHPWVFSGALARVDGEPADGDVVDVVDAGGAFLARGLYNSRSQIRVRSYIWRPDQALDDAFLREQIRDAVEIRRRLGLLREGTACRLVFSEADGLSGLVADRYGGWLAVQFTSLALWRRRRVLVEALEEAVPSRGILLRTEKGILEEEGLEVSDGLLAGTEPDGPVEIRENGLTFGVDLRTGQKTGYYLDQRDNRVRAAKYAQGRRVADVCCYTGGFTLALLRAGAASVHGVDISEKALELARSNLELNGLDAGLASFSRSDAFRWLESSAEARERFGMVVLDPPRMARSERGVKGALRGYARLNQAAVRVLEPGGILVTCSCTGRISMDRFQGILADVERRTGRRLRLLERHGQPADHPVAPTCPETSYLKCLVAVVE
jgi:23S rRNA (cytosine1962-C5)-methyltransferase